jgi:hypothetical protein
VQEPRSRAVPRVENQSSPGLLPMAAATSLSCDQEGKGGGSSPFILRERRGGRVWEGVMSRRGVGRGGARAFRVFFPPLLQAWPS